MITKSKLKEIIKEEIKLNEYAGTLITRFGPSILKGLRELPKYVLGNVAWDAGKSAMSSDNAESSEEKAFRMGFDHLKAVDAAKAVLPKEWENDGFSNDETYQDLAYLDTHAIGKDVFRPNANESVNENLKISKGHGRGQSWTNYDDDTYRMQVTKDANQYHISIFKKFQGPSSKRLLDIRGLSKQNAARIVKLAKKVGLVKLVKSSQIKKLAKEGKINEYGSNFNPTADLDRLKLSADTKEYIQTARDIAKAKKYLDDPRDSEKEKKQLHTYLNSLRLRRDRLSYIEDYVEPDILHKSIYGESVEKINEGGKFRLSADADLMWHGSNIIIISGRHRVVLDRKELGNIIAAAKRHRLT